ncbi:hypothetical protein AB0J83_29105 [Actinoplanes sp. NPDC049596]|uniref:hypothetical protein n=1 Tax=unclassified Actinoplanes TaxID=2626549 RepID=UPI003431EE45
MRKLDVAVATAGLLVVVSSFLPWYRSLTASSHNGVDSTITKTASAWTASTWWSVAIVLAIAATGLWFLLRRRVWRWVAPVLAGAAALVVVWAWQAIPPLIFTGGAWTSDAGGGGEVGDIVRDNLLEYHVDGLDFDVAWGLYAGLAALLLLTSLLVAAALRRQAAARP